jgi:predicted acylesterase/phospholipase RssA
MTEKLQCDLVMRGGITSGIVYPRAIAKLAETYRFRSIGGTSAGAIAATGTAAAAYGAKTGKDHFANRFKTLPDELGKKPGTRPGVEGKKTVLERLFQAQEGTRRLFNVLMSGLGRQGLTAKIAFLVWSLCANYWLYAIVGAAVALLPLVVLAATSGLGGALWIPLLVGLLPALLFILAATSVGVVRDVLLELPRNGYGLCSGSSNNVPDDAGVLPLTDWLHDFFQSVANRKASDAPVTFGDLWGTRDERAERDIELVLMTTNITRGISQRLPFLEGNWGQLFFKEEEFAELFPESIVEHMRTHAANARYPKDIDTAGFVPLPPPEDLPILLGARMSLSFPFLLSAVPLYAANFEAEKTKDGKYPLERCWFSDGGLTSNFPLHFFDSPLPSRPTFAINLIPYEVAATEVDEVGGTLERVSGVAAEDPKGKTQQGWDRVWMPSRNSSGIGSAARFNKFQSVAGFFGALFDTARNWADTELMALPGYRERVVHVQLAEHEGGMNLNMGSDLIEEIGARGERAGELLAARYGPNPEKDPQSGDDIALTWDNHRWIRYRATMAAFEDLARRFRKTWGDAAKQKPWRGYEALLDRGSKDTPTSYPLQRPDQQNFASEATRAFVELVSRWQPDQTFDRGEDSSQGRSPRPKPALRMMPLGSNDPRAERAD